MRSYVYIHTNEADTLHYNFIKCAIQLFLRYIMLVHAYTQMLRLNFYQFCKRVL